MGPPSLSIHHTGRVEIGTNILSSDIWAFGCIVYQLIVGKPPFRGATDYLTFQKILKNEMEFPEGFDADAKALIEVILVSRKASSTS